MCGGDGGVNVIKICYQIGDVSLKYSNRDLEFDAIYNWYIIFIHSRFQSAISLVHAVRYSYYIQLYPSKQLCIRPSNAFINTL